MPRSFLSDPALDGVTHGFFTRLGGVSTGLYTSLNCGQSSDDTSENVAANRAIVADDMGVAPENLLSVYQIHSPDVVTVTEAPWPDGRPKADAMVTRTKGIALGILTADCAPVLFADVGAGVVGAAHAGWKGALGGVTDSTIAAMIRLGASRENIVAVVGPCISQRAYEVGPEFFETFLTEDPAFSRFFTNGEGDRYLFDLPMFVVDKLRQAEIKDAGWIGRCTFSEPEGFFSYRRTTHAGEPDYGRQISVIRL